MEKVKSELSKKMIIYSLVTGLIASLVYAYLIYICDDVGCAFLSLIFLVPGSIIEKIFGLNINVGLQAIVFYTLIWFLLGSLIGFLVYKVKKK